ncbi:E3 ubiquitin-protein ligase pellino homolog 3 isoform X3 [Pteronotus mesoamericanus]|uniref:E3 ubiquitin-protein ligase pellino homolog n=1 Tax=Molossus molossus TaxID=27622 RepID=A0A7J8EU62_MOLMO|nr:E3 ubiquitin-protein ligase pellino homolog 3 isoform X3 [Pteronotus parnellii mesoamericanus]KAF6438619.1 pellino E3 ubiquitin protein ligase family member 3 [Molossus molossus]
MVLEGNPEVGSPRTSDLQHPGNQGSCVLSSPGEDAQPGEEPIKYGELIVLGCCEEGGEETEAQRGEVTGPRAHSCYNGCLSNGDKGRRRSRLALSRRPHANGVKPDVMHHISTPLVSKALSNRGQHSISYTLSRSHSVIVEYTHDSDTDMFQIGRSTENMIDFVVTDTSPGGGAAEGPSAQSTISRYACRILCDRRPPYTARIYAAGFDASSNIFLGVENESNVLQDGSLIDLCGATLLWRTPAGLLRAPTLKQLEAQRQEANAARPQCPVGLSTLAFPSPARGRTAPDKQQPWVYVRCGHVHGYHGWGCRRERGPQERECPLCRLVGPYVPLWLGQEAGLCLDPGPPSHAFAPCGHVCSEKTARYWAQTPLPHGTHAFHAACPFCGAWLTGEHGCVRLIFQGPLD